MPVCSELAIPKLRGHNGRLCSAMASAERTGTHLAHMEVSRFSTSAKSVEEPRTRNERG